MVQVNTPEEMLSYGDHLCDVRKELSAVGLLLLQNAGCVHEHVGAEHQQAVMDFVGGTLKDVCLALDAQMEDLSKKLDEAAPEVEGLESLFQAPTAEPPSVDHRPGQGGYL